MNDRKSIAEGIGSSHKKAVVIFCWRCAVSSTHAPKKSSQDEGGLGGKAQRNTTKENSTANEPSPASLEEYSASLYAIRSNLLKFFELIEHSAALIDAAYARYPFLLHLPPDAPANRRRFNTYLDQYRQVSKLLFNALELWRLSFGISIVRPSKPPARKRTDKGRTRKS